jgi:hypothetical protein
VPGAGAVAAAGAGEGDGDDHEQAHEQGPEGAEPQYNFLLPSPEPGYSFPVVCYP